MVAANQLASPVAASHPPANTNTQAGAAVASSSSVWQVTEPLPQLSSEPALAERLLEDGQGLIEMVASCDIAINALLHEQQVRVEYTRICGCVWLVDLAQASLPTSRQHMHVLCSLQNSACAYTLLPSSLPTNPRIHAHQQPNTHTTPLFTPSPASHTQYTNTQEKAISALSPAKQLKIPEVKRQLEGLREVVQGGLGLGSGGKASRGQQVREKSERE